MLVNRTPVTERIEFRYTALGEPFFLPKTAESHIRHGESLSPQNFSSKELRQIADFMDKNPDCVKFSDQ